MKRKRCARCPHMAISEHYTASGRENLCAGCWEVLLRDGLIRGHVVSTQTRVIHCDTEACTARATDCQHTNPGYYYYCAEHSPFKGVN